LSGSLDEINTWDIRAAVKIRNALRWIFSIDDKEEK